MRNIKINMIRFLPSLFSIFKKTGHNFFLKSIRIKYQSDIRYHVFPKNELISISSNTVDDIAKTSPVNQMLRNAG